jgi:prolyl oligopeptidase PreP (S9A serine peptidase family)
VRHPATLMLTGEHDDRAVPARGFESDARRAGAQAREIGVSSSHLALAVFGGAAAHALPEDAAEVEAVREAAVGGDLFDAEVAQNEKLGRLLDAHPLDP